MYLVPGVIWALLLYSVKFHSSSLRPGVFTEVRHLVDDDLETGIQLLTPSGMNIEDGEATNCHCNWAGECVRVPLCVPGGRSGSYLYRAVSTCVHLYVYVPG